MPQAWNGEPRHFPQPYEQLIKVFKAASHERDARLMAVAKLDAYRDFLRRYAKKHPNDRRWLSRSWLWFIGGLIRYGYEPWRIALPIILALLYGGVIFSSAHHAGYMAPTKERVYLADCYRKDCGDWIKPERSWTNSNDGVLRLPPDYPEFNSLVYAIDTFFPIVDLHQEAYWSPRSEGFGGGFFRGFLWLYIISGWVLTTIGVVGFTGIIKKD